MRPFPLGTGAPNQFFEGEPVYLASGVLTLCDSDPAQVDGISAARSTGGFASYQVAGTLIPVYETDRTNTFRSHFFATDGAATDAVPTQANAIGQVAGIILGGSNWYIDTGATNLILYIVDVWDNEGRSITNPNDNPGAGYWVVFRFI